MSYDRPSACTTGMAFNASTSMLAPAVHAVTIAHVYDVECLAGDGSLRWRDSFYNLVPIEGLNQYLTATLVAGAVAPLWYVGLKNTGSVAASDTMASHTGWAEITNYSDLTRPQWIPGSVAAGSVSNVASKAQFNINFDTLIYGAFMTSDATKGGLTGTMLGVGDFTSARQALNGDTLSVTVYATMASSGSV